MITSALFLTLRNVIMMTDVGMKTIFFNVIAAFAFLIPAALVSAELASFILVNKLIKLIC